MKNLRFVFMLLKMKLSRQMMYRMSFFGGALVDSSGFLIWLFMFQTIYAHVDTIGGWDRSQTIVFLGTFSLLNAINMVFYFFGVITIPGKIKNGDLDNYLTKPLNPLLRLSFENMDLGSSPLIIISIAIIIYGLKIGNVQVNFLTLILYSVFILLMTVLYYDMEVILRTIPFFVISAEHIQRLEDAAFDLCMRVPGVLFQGVYKIIFYFLLPYGIMATVPAQILTGTATTVMVATSVAIVIIFTVFTLWFWRFGLKHYKSASS